MSDENGREIGINVYNEDEDELIEDEDAAVVAPQPVGIVREEIVTVTKNSDTEDNDSEDNLNEVVKAHSDQISRLTEIVESLQSQIKLIDQRQSGSSIRKNTSTTKTKKSKTTSKKSKGKSSTRK